MKRYRLNIEVSASTMRKIILWSHSRDEKKNSWVKTVLVLRADENEEKVKRWFDDEAERLGITREELENIVLEKDGFDINSYKADMLSD